MRIFLLILVMAGAAGAARAADRPATLPDTMQQRLAPCLGCHARPDRDDAFFPRIAGKPAGYLYNQLANFRDGRRQFPMMTWMVAQLPDAYLHEIADWFSTADLPHPPPAPSVPGTIPTDRGRQLVRHGDPTLRIPACVACHGARLTGVAPAIPGLVGLPRDYINAQFGAWKDGQRHALAPDCMGDIAGRISLQDVAAISNWLASQPLPADLRPADAVTRPLPLRCGSSPD
jgi:cytochrome c553